MTERLTASITSNGSTITAGLDINPKPNITFSWKNAAGAIALNPGTDANPPDYLNGDGLVQSNTYRLVVNVSNYPAGTPVTLSVATVSGFNPANITAVNATTDGSKNAVFNVYFNPTPAATTFSPMPFAPGGFSASDGKNVYASFTATVNGLAAGTIVPVLYGDTSNIINIAGDSDWRLLHPGCYMDIELLGGGGASSTLDTGTYPPTVYDGGWGGEGYVAIHNRTPLVFPNSAGADFYSNLRLAGTGTAGGAKWPPTIGNSNGGIPGTIFSAGSAYSNSYIEVFVTVLESIPGRSGVAGGASGYTSPTASIHVDPTGNGWNGAGGPGYQLNGMANKSGSGASGNWLKVRIAYRLKPAAVGRVFPPIPFFLSGYDGNSYGDGFVIGGATPQDFYSGYNNSGRPGTRGMARISGSGSN